MMIIYYVYLGFCFLFGIILGLNIAIWIDIAAYKKKNKEKKVKEPSKRQLMKEVKRQQKELEEQLTISALKDRLEIIKKEKEENDNLWQMK